MSEVESFYDNNVEREWLRLERHRTEFAVTMRVLDEYLSDPPAEILDIGGGPGRYAIALTQQGYSVTLLDLSSKTLEFAQQKAAEAGVQVAGFVHADATDLYPIKSASCDATLLMGPLYHLLRGRDRRQAVSEAYRVLKPYGLLFASFISRYAAIRWAAKYQPEWIVEEARKCEDLLVTGINSPPPDAGFTDSYFALPSEIKPLMESGGFEPLDLIACEGVVSMIEEGINELTGDLWDAWVNMNYLLGKDPTVHGAAEHLLCVARKV